MLQILTNFADSQHAAQETGGLSALGINLQSFLFQLVTFVIVLLILKRWVLPRLVATLEARQAAVEQSIRDAQAASDKLAKAEENIAEMMREARQQADEVIARSHKEAAAQAEATEQKAAKQAERIVASAQEQMQAEQAQGRANLKQETAQLVAEATGAILKQKVDAKSNAKLIETSLDLAQRSTAASSPHFQGTSEARTVLENQHSSRPARAEEIEGASKRNNKNLGDADERPGKAPNKSRSKK